MNQQVMTSGTDLKETSKASASVYATGRNHTMVAVATIFIMHGGSTLQVENSDKFDNGAS